LYPQSTGEVPGYRDETKIINGRGTKSLSIYTNCAVDDAIIFAMNFVSRIIVFLAFIAVQKVMYRSSKLESGIEKLKGSNGKTAKMAKTAPRHAEVVGVVRV